MDRWTGETHFERIRQAPLPEIPEQRVPPLELLEPRGLHPELAPRQNYQNHERRVRNYQSRERHVRNYQNHEPYVRITKTTSRTTPCFLGHRFLRLPQDQRKVQQARLRPPSKRERRDPDTCQEPPVPTTWQQQPEPGSLPPRPDYLEDEHVRAAPYSNSEIAVIPNSFLNRRPRASPRRKSMLPLPARSPSASTTSRSFQRNRGRPRFGCCRRR